MGFDDGADNGETHSQTFFFSSKELVEEMFVNLVGNTRAMIAHTHVNAATTVSLCRNFQGPTAGGCMAHRFKCIGDEIDQHLMELDRIPFYHRQTFRERKLHVTRASSRVRYCP